MEILTPSLVDVWKPFVASGLVAGLWILLAGPRDMPRWRLAGIVLLPPSVSYLWAASELLAPFRLSIGLLVYGGLTLGLIALAPKAERTMASSLAAFLVLASLVGFFSGSKGGADPFVRLFQNTFGLELEAARQATLIMRKCIHFGTYGLLAAFAAGAHWQLARSNRSVLAILALGSAACLAAFDELRQLGYTNRSGSVWDFLLDMSGATCFVLLILGVATKPRDLLP